MTKFESLSLTAAYLNLFASFGGLGLLYYGIRVMAKGAEMRATDSERKHTEVMTESEHKHTETMTESGRRHNEVMTESERRHNDFLADSRRREEEGLRRHEESMAALRELIDGQTESRAALRESIVGHAESRMALRELIERTR